MAESKAETVVAESNRRVDPRYPPSAMPAITGMRLSPGEAVSLVNISASGVLVEGKTRFVPGTRVTVHFEGTIKPNQIKARVRSEEHTSELQSRSTISYAVLCLKKKK